VKEMDNEIAGTMPELTIARKFHNWQAANEIRTGLRPNRNYAKNEYIYTSQKYPSGIASGISETWEPQKHGTLDVLNVYIVDSILNVAGTLEVTPKTVVKFATADKSSFLTDYSGRSNSSIKVASSGRLIISGGAKDSEKVLFTSLDDDSAAPSAYTGSDLDFIGLGGLQNRQLVKNKAGVGWYSGVKCGDWGNSDGTPANSFGGIFIQNPTNSSVKNLELRYGLIYTKGIYPGGVKPDNYNTTEGINEWNRTNVFVINDTLEINYHSSLKIGQGAIVKFSNNAAILCRPSYYPSTPTIFKYPYYSVIADGSPAEPIYFTHVSSNNISQHKEEKTPNLGAGKWSGIEFDGLGSNCVFKNIYFGCMSGLKFSGSNTTFRSCEINSDKSTIDQNFVLSLENSDNSIFRNNSFIMTFPGRIELKSASVCEFISNYCHFYFNNGAGSANDSFISVGSSSTLVAQKNRFREVEEPGFMTANSFNGSKIVLKSSAYINDNLFKASNSSNKGTSCEISIISSPLPVIKNNLFENCKTAIYVSGSGYDTTSAILNDKIVNNTFTNCNTILKTDVTASGEDFPQSPSNATVDKDNNIYFTDTTKNCIYKYTPNGRLLMTFGSPGSGDGQFNSPVGIAVNDTGEIYVVDQGNKRIQKFDAAGNFILKFGQ